MKNYLNIAARSVIAATAALLVLGFAYTRAWAAEAADPLAGYYDNTLVCQNQTTKAKCWLWLNRDGRYFAFYDVGPQAKAPDINGPFKINGREGTYTLRKDDGKYKLCLWIAAPRPKITAELQQEIFSEAACYAFTPHKAGDTWTSKDIGGRDYKFWLMEGR